MSQKVPSLLQVSSKTYSNKVKNIKLDNETRIEGQASAKATDGRVLEMLYESTADVQCSDYSGDSGDDEPMMDRLEASTTFLSTTFHSN